MHYYEANITLVVKQRVDLSHAYQFFSGVINRAIGEYPELLKIHYNGEICNYVFGLPFPIDKVEKAYKQGKAYSMNIRSFDKEFLQKICLAIPSVECGVKLLTTNIREVEKMLIESMTSLTPVVATIDKKYWTREDNILLIKDRMHSNAAKKAKMLNPNFIEPQESFISGIEILSNKSTVIQYKDGVILGTKVIIYIENDEKSQEMAFAVLGMGLLEKNSLGMGFCSIRNWKEV